jgi:hypothetical protein
MWEAQSHLIRNLTPISQGWAVFFLGLCGVELGQVFVQPTDMSRDCATAKFS